MVADRDPERDAELATALSELRLIKDDLEVACLEEACAATATGFTECVRELAAARQLPNGERWLEGTFWRRARVDGNDVGYGTIVACGDHATRLHWTRDDGAVRDGDLALLDMGVESRNLYTADVTRTLPVSGRFTPEQRKVYDVVWKAQRAAIAATRPGVDFLEPHRVAMRIITEALIAWGVLEGDLDEVLRDQLHRRFTLHSTSHHLGIDVHDCAKARKEYMREGTLAAGMVITIEPGLYFQRDDTFAPAELRGIGVRIEDDVLVTDEGCRVLSDALPTEAGEVEAWMAALL
jgi:Xaa-Pro aminopeptidase